MTVPYTFGNESSPIPLSQLDANFATIPAFANTAGNVSNAAQPAITSVGTLTSLSVSGNVGCGNVTTNGLVSAAGNITGGNLLTLGSVSAFGTVAGGNFQTSGNILANNITGTGLIQTANNVIGGNIYSSGEISTTGNISAQGIISATGNVVTDQYFVGNFLGNITGNLSVGGSNTQVLFNQNGNVGAAAGLTYNAGSNTLGVLGVVSAQGNMVAGGLQVSGTAQFTGVVTAPTATAGTANNQIATTAFVSSTVGTLGTMATQNAVSVAITGGTIGNGILTLASISNSNISASNISGSYITAATPAPGTSNTQVATTAFVSSAVGSLGTMSTQNASSVAITGGSMLGVSGFNPGLNVGYATTAGNGGVTSINGQTGAVAVAGLGLNGEQWHSVGRSFNTTYTNPYSYPIAVSATATCAVTSTIYGYVNGLLVAWYQWQFNGCGSFGGTFIIVPPGATYQLNSSQGVYNWVELY